MTAVFENVFMTVFNMSITGSILIIAVMLLRLMLKRAPKYYCYFLWYLPFFRLICPVSFSSFMSFFNLFDTSEIYSGTTVSYIPNDVMTFVTDQSATNNSVAASGAVIEQAVQIGTDLGLLQLLQGAIVSVWLVGVTAILVYSIFSHYKVKSITKTAVKLKDNIYECDNIPSPFVLGVFRSKIYIPFGLSENERDYIIFHERHHIIRCDHIKKSIAFFITAVHWFNPLCWLGFTLMNRDMEMSCDEKVLEKNEGISKKYCTSLLSFATDRRFPAPSPLTFSESGVEERIKNALKWKEPARWVVRAAAVLCVMSLFVFAANPKTDEISGREFYKRNEEAYFPEKSELPVNAEIKYFDREDGGVFPASKKVILMRFDNESEYTKEKKKLHDKLFDFYKRDLGYNEFGDGWKAVYVKDWVEADGFYDPECEDYIRYCCFGAENDSKQEIMYCSFYCPDQDYFGDFGIFVEGNYSFAIQEQTYEKVSLFHKDKRDESKSENALFRRFDASKITNTEDLVVSYRMMPPINWVCKVYNKNGDVFFRFRSTYEPVVKKVTDRVIKVEYTTWWEDFGDVTITEQYFDVYDSGVSDEFRFVLGRNSERVIYATQENSEGFLVVQNLFAKEKSYYNLPEDLLSFSVYCILSAEFSTDNEEIILTYIDENGEKKNVAINLTTPVK